MTFRLLARLPRAVELDAIVNIDAPAVLLLTITLHRLVQTLLVALWYRHVVIDAAQLHRLLTVIDAQRGRQSSWRYCGQILVVVDTLEYAFTTQQMLLVNGNRGTQRIAVFVDTGARGAYALNGLVVTIRRAVELEANGFEERDVVQSDGAFLKTQIQLEVFYSKPGLNTKTNLPQFMYSDSLAGALKPDIGMPSLVTHRHS